MRSWLVALGGFALVAVGGQASWTMLLSSGSPDRVIGRPVVAPSPGVRRPAIGGPVPVIAPVDVPDQLGSRGGVAADTGEPAGTGADPADVAPAGQQATPRHSGVPSTVTEAVTTLDTAWTDPTEPAVPTAVEAPTPAVLVAPTSGAVLVAPTSGTVAAPSRKDDARERGHHGGTARDD
ncbi:MAG TPA: hypothetical protein VI248_26900 [Kineosporiaceae bacterium]